MRVPGIAVFCVLLGSCAASAPEVGNWHGQEYVGRKIDVLMVKWGPPTSTIRLHNGQTSLIWQLTTEMSADLARSGSGSVTTYACKVHVIASATGMIQQIDTENYRAGEGLLSFAGTAGSMCGEWFGVKSQG